MQFLFQALPSLHYNYKPPEHKNFEHYYNLARATLEREIALPQEETLTVEDVKDFQKDLKKQEKSKLTVKNNQKNSKKDNV